MSEPILHLSDITKTFNLGKPNEVSVLRGVDLMIARGEMVALTAPSGAGKSTLLHICGLLDQPGGGQLTIDGEELTRASDRKRTAVRREKIGFVYQFHHLLPNFTALENCVIPQRAAGASVKDATLRAREFLERVGLGGRETHRPDMLSGGEQQRVAICRAMMNQPKLLLADEPTGNLDPETSWQVFEMLQTLIEETGLAALIVTHNPNLAGKMHRNCILENGRL